MASKKISILLADVDGTLVDSQKRITARAKAAIEKLTEAGIKFAVTSGRPPRGMKMIVEAVKLSAPLAAFNGGMLVEPDTMKVLVQQTLDAEIAQDVIERVGGGNVASAGSDDESEFGLIVGACRDLGQHNWCAGTNHYVCKFIEDGGDGGDLHAGFPRMIAIVQAHADELRRARNGRQQRDVGQFVRGPVNTG